MTTTDEGLDTRPTVHELMGRILAELPAIGKNQRNSEQGFMFRGMDDVLDALNPVMARHGVFCMPDVIERVTDRRATRSNSTMYEVNLHVRFTFYGPRGDSVVASGWGEGTDMGDKATNKAMTNAFKYVLFQTFAISTREAAETDNDRHTPEETIPNAMQCRECSNWIEGARSDVEVMRAHVVDQHAFVRLENGKVEHPDAYAKRMAAEAEVAGERVAANPTPDPAPDEAQQPEAAPAKAAPAKKAAPKKAAAKPAPAPEPDPDPADDTPTDDEAASAAPVAEDAPADDVPEGEGFACPGDPEGTCDAPPFATEQEYIDHWYAVHETDPDAADPAGTDAAPEPAADEPAGDDDHAATVATVKARISALTGEAARAYGKYRREAKLPRPDELDADQAAGLLAFLDELAAAG